MAARGRNAAAPPARTLHDFRTLIGFETERAAWARLLAHGRLPQVLLLTGRQGSGKRLALAALAAMPDCERGTACGTCANCLAVIHDAHPEVLWIEGEGERLGLDEAEALAAHLALSPQAGSRARTVIVPDAERLGGAAANRLLKLLEEPPPAARIFLSSGRVQAMLPTVLSRCVRWRLAPPPVAAAVAWLAQRMGENGGVVPEHAQLERVLIEAGRAPGLALTRLRDATPAEAEPRTLLRELLAARGPTAALTLAERLAKAGLGADGKSAATLAAGTLDAWEMALNAAYRAAWPRQEEAAAWLSPQAVEARRKLMSQARRLVVRGKVPLNAQLAAEALGLEAPSPRKR